MSISEQRLNPSDKHLRLSTQFGVEHVMGSADGLRRFLALSGSRHHRRNFCQGTVAEMFRAPGQAMIPLIEEFAATGRIYMAFALGYTRGLLQAAGVWSTLPR